MATFACYVYFLSFFQGMANVIVEIVTVLPVGMETNVNSNVTSAHGKASGGAHLQMAKSAATEVCGHCSKSEDFTKPSLCK